MSKVIKRCFIVNDGHTLLRGWVPEPILTGTKQKSSPLPAEKNAEKGLAETKITLAKLIAEEEQKAERILFSAREKAEEHLARSRAESETIKESAYQEGLMAGTVEAREKYEKEISSVHEASLNLLANIEAERKKFYQGQKKELIELIFVLLEKITGTVIEAMPEGMKLIIANLLEEFKENETVVIRVHPVHVPYLCSFDGYFREHCNDRFQVIADAEISPGNCQIITENGFVDSKIDEQINLLKQALMGAVARDEN